MKYNRLLPLLLCCAAFNVFAQSPVEKGLKSINRASAEAYVRFLASDELEGREAGKHGSKIAARYLASLLQQWEIQPLAELAHGMLIEEYYHPFTIAVRNTPKTADKLPADSLIKRAKEPQRVAMQNVLGMIRGKKTDEYVIVGAHFDHLGINPQHRDDSIFNGADDNASGVSAVLQIAKAFVASGCQPERTVIFAFWDGEEKGLCGSTEFVRASPFVSRIKSYLNFDMIGRNNRPEQPKHVVYFYTEAHPDFGRWMKEDLEKYAIDLEPVYRPWDKPVGGSDNAPFARVGIPVIWYHTDGHPDYHKPSDEADKLNWEKVVEISKASFLNVWRMANEEAY